MNLGRKGVLLILSGIISILGQPSEDTLASSACLNCHRDFFNKVASKLSVHYPFQQGECETCHIEYEAKLPYQSSNRLKPQKSIVNQQIAVALSTGLNLIALKPSWQMHRLSIKLQEASGIRRIEKQILFKDISSLKLIEIKKPLAIEDLKVIEITKGVFVEATASWKTSIPSRCEIHYGIIDGTDEVIYQQKFALEHKIGISPLRPNKEYYLSIVARSVNGQIVQSRKITFRSDDLFSKHRAKNTVRSQKLFNNIEILRINDQPFLLVTPCTELVIRIRPCTPEASIPVRLNTTEGHEVSEKRHPLLLSTYQSGYLSCLKCHQGEASNTHPINIRPRSGMHPPSDVCLPDGKLACITCHDPHAGRYKYLLRREQSALCHCCHSPKRYVARSLR